MVESLESALKDLFRNAFQELLKKDLFRTAFQEFLRKTLGDNVEE